MTDPEPARFEHALDELEGVLRELEDGSTGLEDALARYERGVVLLRQCYGQLKDAEQRVRLLAGVTADGGPDLRPFEHTSAIETAKAAVRKKPRATPGDDIPF
ncbi:MAG: exodeoxyribonuclease VII small subunit [Gemmataceae bacterium]|nr:exodeoxyribonuclease VII small subunit [Gemmataceae bacterium]